MSQWRPRKATAGSHLPQATLHTLLPCPLPPSLQASGFAMRSPYSVTVLSAHCPVCLREAQAKTALPALACDDCVLTPGYRRFCKDTQESESSSQSEMISTQVSALQNTDRLQRNFCHDRNRAVQRGVGIQPCLRCTVNSPGRKLSKSCTVLSSLWEGQGRDGASRPCTQQGSSGPRVRE